MRQMNKEEIKVLFAKVRQRKPLIHHLTNAVTINDCANVTLAVGASPVMAVGEKEVEHMVRLANALVVNIGTLTDSFFESALLAGKAANKKGIPVVFDPVGAGATPYRTERAKEFLEKVDVSIVRGNGSEIHALIGGNGKTKGVDAGEVSIPMEELVLEAAKELKTVVVISGKQDYISDGKEIIRVDNGDIWLTQITGTGCMTTSLIACFAAVTENLPAAATAGMSVMGLAGERAKEAAGVEGIGTYRMKLMDEIFRMDGDIWEEGVRLL